MVAKSTSAGLALLIAGTLLTASPAIAAGTDSGSTPRRAQPGYTKAVRAVRAGDYRTAIGLLERVVADDGTNADAYNYLAFSHRKLGQLEQALRYYRKALVLDPEHKGAHEYIGELYLQLGDSAEARKHLARLDEICWLGCEEYDELKVAIERYESGHSG